MEENWPALPSLDAFFGGLPLGLEAGAMGTFPPSAPLSPLTGVGRVLPINTGATSDSLEKGDLVQVPVDPSSVSDGIC